MNGLFKRHMNEVVHQWDASKGDAYGNDLAAAQSEVLKSKKNLGLQKKGRHKPPLINQNATVVALVFAMT
jgi:hypothetical protein